MKHYKRKGRYAFALKCEENGDYPYVKDYGPYIVSYGKLKQAVRFSNKGYAEWVLGKLSHLGLTSEKLRVVRVRNTPR